MGDFEYEIGPLGHLAAERERLASLTWRAFDVVPLAATIGAEISGVTVSGDLPDAVIAELRQALLDYKVLFFRDLDQSKWLSDLADSRAAYDSLRSHYLRAVQNPDELETAVDPLTEGSEVNCPIIFVYA